MLLKLTVAIVMIAGWNIPMTQAEDLAASAMIAGDQYNVEPERIVAMMWVESRFKLVKGDGGLACGPMQVHARFSKKPGGGTYTCDEMLDPLTGVTAGVELYSRWRKIRGPSNALGHYNSGKILTTRGQSYQRYVQWQEKRIKRLLSDPDDLGHLSDDVTIASGRDPVSDGT